MADEKYPHNEEARRRMAEPPTPSAEEANRARDPHYAQRAIGTGAPAAYKNRAIEPEQAATPQETPEPPAAASSETDAPAATHHRRTRSARSTIASDERTED